MRTRLQFTVERETFLSAAAVAPLVKLEAWAPKRAAAVEIMPVREVTAPEAEATKKGVVVEWPSKLSATLRRMKAAITPAANTEALKLFESPTGGR